MRKRRSRCATQQRSRRKFHLESLENRIVLDSTVVFNELMYNPVGDTDDTHEWIEFHNQLAVDMDVSEWQLTGGVEFEFPAGTTVPGRGFLVVAAAPAALEATTGFADAIGPYAGSLSNGGEKIRLINNDGRVVNVLDYGDGGKWPVGPDGGGVTLAKRDELTSTGDIGNWTFSQEVGGTPGNENFTSREQTDLFSILPEGSAVRAFVPSNDSLGTSWIDPDFDDATWLSGNAGIGFEKSSGFETLIGLDIEQQMLGRNSFYVRVPFATNVNSADMESFVLRMKYDDGFVGYLNGVEVARANAPADIAWNALATNSHADSDAVAFQDFDISAHKDLLVQDGTNVLAIQGMNQTVGSSDLLISPAIGYKPLAGGGGNVNSQTPLVINEVTPATGEVLVELANLGSQPIDLGGVVLSATGAGGGEHTFGAETILAGGMLTISETEMGLDLADGERLFLYTPAKATLLDAQPVTNRLRGRSTRHDGQWLFPDVATLGTVNSFAFHDEIVINEIMYHAQPQLAAPETPYAESNEEWIELYNRGTTPVDLGGWELRDAVRYSFDPGTVIASGEYLVVARDAAALAQKYPGITLVGDFDGTLSNTDDRIVLVDDRANPADEVHYYERGQWPLYADGGGSSLELRDPDADNSKASAWAVSDEAAKSEWNTYTVRRTATEPMQISTSFNEFIFGMLDEGEILVDDVSVVLDPATNPQQMIQNGTFQGDAIGFSPARWRLIGNHRGTVVSDPDDPSNKVLHVIADGPQQHVHDHAETTFVNNTSVRNGRTYEVTFRAKWLAGSRQLNNRLYFTRMSNTVILDAPQNNGTPGARNSAFVQNIGPTYAEFRHAPILPAAGEAVTVSVMADDPDGITSMTLRWNRSGAGWNTVAMTDSGNGKYIATIPGQSSGQVVQFYVEGQDGLDATSTYPAAGPDSRALYQVDDGRNPSQPIESLRVVMLNSDNSQLFSSVNRMSNNYVGGTLIRGGEEAFYDVGVRQIGSRFVRPNSGYKVKLNPEHKFYGVHDSIRLDLNELKEIIFKQMVNRAGGSSVSMYDDITFLVTPQHGTRTILLNLARYEDVYLNEQFENGGDGTKFELDDITYPTGANPSPEGLKSGTEVSAQDIRYRGSDPESYRGQLLIRNNRSKDDYEPLVEFARAINLNGTALDEAIDDVMDVDLWMRHYATQAFLGNWDTWGFSRPKNLRIYIRPSDGKVIPLYWDADLANLTEPLIYNGGASRLDEIRNRPTNSRLFWGHMWDLMNRGFNVEYAQSWATHYNALGAGTAGEVSKIANRVNQARSQAVSSIPMVPFNITTNNGNALSVDDTLTTLSGDGWIDVREIRLASTDDPLEVTWTDQNSWEVKVPLEFGENVLAFEAFDFEGNSIGVDTITVTSTSTERPLRDFLRITEINYNPLGSDDTEFIELSNIAPPANPQLDLTGVRFTEGITFDFTGATVTTLAPGDRILVVKDPISFAAAYAPGLNIAGSFTGSLANEGEMLTLRDADNATIQHFSYNDEWYDITDGGGYTLTTHDANQDLELWDSKAGWRPSERTTGSPGTGDNGVAPESITINEVSNNATTGNWIELHNTMADPMDIGHWYLSDDELDQPKFQFQPNTVIPAGGFLVLTEDEHFGTTANPGAANPFALSELGGQLHLRSADAANVITGYREARAYGAGEPDVTHGLTGSSNGAVYAILTGATRGAANLGPAIGSIAINEIMYNPQVGEVDFIELKNVSGNDVVLNDGQGNAWGFIEGIQFQIPAGAVIAADNFLVLIGGEEGGDASQEASDFRAANDVPASVDIFVYTNVSNGVLDNGGEKLSIARPSSLITGLVVVDTIDYGDSSPWPAAADGEGPSLSRLVAGSFGNDPANWGAGSFAGTPGRENGFLDTTPPSDPAGLVGRLIGSGQVALAWTNSTDIETGIDHYNVYRDGQLAGTSPLPWYTETVVFDSESPFVYEVSAVNEDGIESDRSVPVNIGAQSVDFQNGIGGYSGSRDAEIREGNPNSNNGLTDQALEVDGEDGGTDLSVLLRWEDLSIPAGSQVVGASFTVNVFNGGHQYNVNQVLKSWEEGEVTWNNVAAGQPWQTSGAKGNTDRGLVVGTFSGGTGSNTTTFNASGAAMAQSWIDDPSSNNGILLSDPGGSTDGSDFDSREVGTPANRPELTILYVPAPQPLVSGDFNLDDVVDHDDIRTMCQAIDTGNTDSVFDLDGSLGVVNQTDLDHLIHNVLGTNYGDANLDGVVDGIDFGIWRASRFEAFRSWESGDFTCDGVNDGSDFNVWNENKFVAAAAPTSGDGLRAPRAPLSVTTRLPVANVDELMKQRNVNRAARESDVLRTRRVLASDNTAHAAVVDAWFDRRWNARSRGYRAKVAQVIGEQGIGEQGINNVHSDHSDRDLDQLFEQLGDLDNDR